MGSRLFLFVFESRSLASCHGTDVRAATAGQQKQTKALEFSLECTRSQPLGSLPRSEWGE